MAALAVVAFVVRLAFVPFGRVLTEDAFGYLVKALEITRGNLVPMTSHAIGWPLALAPVLAMAPQVGMTSAMTIARLVSVVFGAMVLIPFSGLCTRIVDRETTCLAVVLVTVSVFLIGTAVSAMSEPLFTLLLVSAVAAVVRARRYPASALWACAWAGLSFWVRPHGLLCMAAVWLALAADRRSDGMPARRWTRLIGAGLVACAVAAPAAVHRQVHLGSPIEFGENTKVFADQPEHVWSANVPAPTLREYLSTHAVRDYADRAVVQGLLRVVRQFAVYVATPALLPLFLVSLVVRARDRTFRPLLIVTGVWLIGLMPHAFGGERHLFPIIPLVMLLVADGFETLARRFRASRHLRAAFTIGVVVVSLAAAGWYRQQSVNDETGDGLEWGRWTAAHVRGTLAIVEGSALVMMHVPDVSVAGVGLMDLYAPTTGLRVMRPGVFPSLGEAMAWMHGAGVTHVAIDDRNIERRPYLKLVRDPATRPACFRQIYSNEGSSSKWVMRIFEVDWAACAPAAEGGRRR